MSNRNPHHNNDDFDGSHHDHQFHQHFQRQMRMHQQMMQQMFGAINQQPTRQRATGNRGRNTQPAGGSPANGDQEEFDLAFNNFFRGMTGFMNAAAAATNANADEPQQHFSFHFGGGTGGGGVGGADDDEIPAAFAGNTFAGLFEGSDLLRSRLFEQFQNEGAKPDPTPEVIIDSLQRKILLSGDNDDLPEPCAICQCDWFDPSEEVEQQQKEPTTTGTAEGTTTSHSGGSTGGSSSGIVKDVVVLPCDHAFHEDCILPWLKSSRDCPLCRAKLPSEEDIFGS